MARGDALSRTGKLGGLGLGWRQQALAHGTHLPLTKARSGVGEGGGVWWEKLRALHTLSCAHGHYTGTSAPWLG
jgi:hypothetical protein